MTHILKSAGMFLLAMSLLLCVAGSLALLIMAPTTGRWLEAAGAWVGTALLFGVFNYLTDPWR